MGYSMVFLFREIITDIAFCIDMNLKSATFDNIVRFLPNCTDIPF